MKTITSQEIHRALSNVGLQRGDTILMYSLLLGPGRIAGVKDRVEFCKIYFDAVTSILGDSGTLVVPTFTPQVARQDIPFVVEQTPSINGLFSEFVRKLPDAMRSRHPIHSFAAVGARKDTICNDVGLSDFGYDSSFHRMHMGGAKILSIGLSVVYGIACVHYIDGICGMPYVYNKLLKWHPITNGVEDSRPYRSMVRHLDLTLKYDFSRLINDLREQGGIFEAGLGNSVVYSSNMKNVVDIAVKGLREDPYYLLKGKPNFVYGQLPFDGPTANRDGINLEIGAGHVGPDTKKFKHD